MDETSFQLQLCARTPVDEVSALILHEGPERKGVLHVSGADDVVLRTFVHALRQRFPDHAVFQSRSGPNPTITVLPVVKRALVLERAEEIRDAIAAYREACSRLVELERRDLLDDAWRVHEHGEHCRFENARTGQVVEAPLDVGGDDEVDPYFFALFVKTTPAFERLATCLRHDFHDADRMLRIADEATPRG